MNGQSALLEQTGTSARPAPTAGCSAASASRCGVRPPAFGLGGPDEYITVRDYLDTVRVHALSTLDFLSRPA